MTGHRFSQGPTRGLRHVAWLRDSTGVSDISIIAIPLVDFRVDGGRNHAGSAAHLLAQRIQRRRCCRLPVPASNHRAGQSRPSVP
jgi:hypothetical protein